MTAGAGSPSIDPHDALEENTVARDDNDVGNPPLPPLLRAVTAVECLVVLTAGLALFVLPFAAKDLWAWAIAPFHARHVGGIYLAALVPLLWMTISGRWSPGRVVLWMIFIFTTLILLAMLPNVGRFAWERVPTWIFWGLYLVLPVHAASFLWHLRRLPPAHAGVLPPAPRAMCLAIALLLGGYGVALLLAPQAAAAFWPWPVDAFHGRLYVASYLTPALGLLVIHRRGSAAEFCAVGITALGMGLMAILCLMITNAQVPAARQVDFSAGATQLFLVLHAASALAGAWVMRLDPRAAAAHRPATAAPVAR